MCSTNVLSAQNPVPRVVQSNLNLMMHKDGFVDFDHPKLINNTKTLTEDINNARSKTLRQDIRVPLSSIMFRIINSQSSETNAKILDVVDISKNGMLIRTDKKVNVGEEFDIDFEYRNMPFEIQAVVVRVPNENSAGIKFVNLDTVNSTIILYLSMFDESL